MNPDYEKEYLYTKADVDSIYDAKSMQNIRVNNRSDTKSNMYGGYSREAAIRLNVMAKERVIKAALLLLMKYKNLRLVLENVETQEAWGPMDPLMHCRNYICRLYDYDKKYMREFLGEWGDHCKDTFLLLLTEQDFEPRYSADDHQNGIKPGEYDDKTLVELRLATKIYKAYKETIK